MTAEVEFVLDVLGSVVDSVDTDYEATLVRIDRDTPLLYEGGGALSSATSRRTKSVDLDEPAAVSASFTGRSTDPIGTEYDHDVEATVSARLEAAHLSEYGAIDPAGVDGVPFDELRDRVRAAILAERTFPSVGRSDTSYTHLRLENETNVSGDEGDYYRYDVDIVFEGYEELP